MHGPNAAAPRSSDRESTRNAKAPQQGADHSPRPPASWSKLRRLLKPCQACPQVVVISVEPVHPCLLLRPLPLRLRFFRETQKPRSRPAAHGLGLPAFFQALVGILPDRFQETITVPAVCLSLVHRQRLVYQSRQEVQHFPGFPCRRRNKPLPPPPESTRLRTRTSAAVSSFRCPSAGRKTSQSAPAAFAGAAERSASRRKAGGTAGSAGR